MPRRGERGSRQAAKPLERGGQVSRIETRELIYTNPKGTAMRRVIRLSRVGEAQRGAPP
ncbi:hypothetical protein [Streptomyces sp. NPDC055140]